MLGQEVCMMCATTQSSTNANGATTRLAACTQGCLHKPHTVLRQLQHICSWSSACPHPHTHQDIKNASHSCQRCLQLASLPASAPYMTPLALTRTSMMPVVAARASNVSPSGRVAPPGSDRRGGVNCTSHGWLLRREKVRKPWYLQ
jgi:hypothetical protein